MRGRGGVHTPDQDTCDERGVGVGLGESRGRRVAALESRRKDANDLICILSS